jgi:undecaprenyl-diphosphatase
VAIAALVALPTVSWLVDAAGLVGAPASADAGTETGATTVATTGTTGTTGSTGSTGTTTTGTPPEDDGPAPRPSEERDDLGTGDAVILGVVEGLTEYLPISSTGHLLVTNRILDIGQDDDTRDAADSYVVVIQAGAILAVLVLYRRRVQAALEGVVGRDPAGRRLAVGLVLSFVPAGVAALALEDPIKDHLFGAGPVVGAWIVGGVAILIWTRRRARPHPGLALEALTPRTALLIGLAQVLALWPGTSRSLVTILAGTALGLSLPAAVEYSFLLGLVTLGAATVFEFVQHGNNIVDTFGWTPVLVGLVAALVAALAAVRWMVAYLQRHDLDVFGWYRIGVGASTIVLIASGAI